MKPNWLLLNFNKLSFFRVLPLVSLAISSCGDQGDRPEVVNKLRGFGVTQSPVGATPGQKVDLTFYLAGPKGMTLSSSVYRDTAFRYGGLADLTLVDANPTETSIGNLSLYTLRASFQTPSDAATLALIQSKGNTPVRYGVRFVNSADGDEETVVGNTILYGASAPELQWSAPQITIGQPVSETIGTTTSLVAAITPAQAESHRVSWLVSSGKVKNPNDGTTEWSEAGTGEQTLILGVRGKNSGAFTFKTMKVTVQ